MSLFDKFTNVAMERKALLMAGSDPFGKPIEELYSPTEASIEGKRILLAGTNNYLGLTFAPECLQAAHDAIEQQGTGTTGSRMANGSFSGHRTLEKELSDFYECRSAIVFTTGYQANLATISGLAGAGDTVVIDADCHASIYDGCRLSGADIVRFRHNNPADLQKRLSRLGEKANGSLVIVEGIYSMLGDRAPLEEIVEIKKSFGAYLLVDEAHSLGILGENGQGLVEETGMLKDTDFVAGTFSKSLASIGGYCVSNHPELDLMRYTSRPYIFTASPSPANVASARAALKILQAGKDLRQSIWQHANQLYSGLKNMGYQLGPEPSPVVAALFDTKEQALAVWHGLLEYGIYVNLIFPPATPGGKTLVRCSVSAAHTSEQIEKILDAFSRLREKIGM